MGLQDYYNASNNSNAAVYGAQWAAQTFIAGATYDISSIKLKLRTLGSPTGNLNVSIRATVAGVPTSVNLISGSISCSLLTSSYAWYGINVTPYELTSGVTYAIVVGAPSEVSGDAVRWAYQTGNPFPDGNLRYSLDSGVTWPSVQTHDCLFETYEGSYFEGTLIATGIGSVVLSYEASTATGTLSVIGVGSILLSHEVCLADEGTLIVQGVCSTLLSYEFCETIEWPFERPEYDPDLYWDEESGAWVSGITGLGRHKQRVVTIGQGNANEGVVYFGDM